MTKMLKIWMTAAACMAAAGCQQQGDTSGKAATGNSAAAHEAAAKVGGGEMKGNRSILDNLAQSPEHSTVVSAVRAAGLTATLSGASPYTLFAPTNAALEKLGDANALMAPEAKGQLTALLTNHIVPGTVTSQDLGRAIERGKGKAQLATVGGGTLTLAKSGDAIMVTDAKGGQARITQADVMQSNGVVHVTDAVLSPQ